MYSLKKMTQKISKTYTLSFPKAAHSLEAQDQGALCDITQRVSNDYTLYSKRPIFRVQSGKKLHQAEKIYTGTACGACAV